MDDDVLWERFLAFVIVVVIISLVGSLIYKYFKAQERKDVVAQSYKEYLVRVDNHMAKDVLFCNSRGGLSHIEIATIQRENDCYIELFCENKESTSLSSLGYHSRKDIYTKAGFFEIETRVASSCGGPDAANEVLLTTD